MKTIETLKKQILPYLETDFEKELLEAAIYNLKDVDNKLRLNNFAYAARELTRHFLERLAPDKEVLHAPWFKPYDKDNSNTITREQRIKYAIQGCFSDEFMDNKLKIDLTDVSANLRKSINDLSKYTHVGPKTFDVDETKLLEVTYGILDDTLGLFSTIDDAQKQVERAVYECIDEKMISQFYIETHYEIDMLATHHEVLDYLVTHIAPIAKNKETITMQTDGYVHVRLQYGSDGDMRRGDGYETEIKLPFTSKFVTNYKNQQGNIYIESAEINIDNDSFFE